MLGFIKRNAKVVIISGVSFLLVAGLTVALVITNIGPVYARAQGRDRDRDRGSVRVELTEEQIAERAAIHRERLEQRLADGRITQEEFDERIAAIESGEYTARSRSGGRSRDRNAEREPLTEEQIAERTEKMRERLAQALADEKITQEEYNEKIEALENGELRGLGRSRGNKSEGENRENQATTTVIPETDTNADTETEAT